MTKSQAQRLIAGCGDAPMAGSYHDVEASALARCEAEARAEGWSGPWRPQPADLDYVLAHLICAGHEPAGPEVIEEEGRGAAVTRPATPSLVRSAGR